MKEINCFLKIFFVIGVVSAQGTVRDIDGTYKDIVIVEKTVPDDRPENIIKENGAEQLTCLTANFDIKITLNFPTETSIDSITIEVPTSSSNLSQVDGACRYSYIDIDGVIYPGPVIVYSWNWPDKKFYDGTYSNRMIVGFTHVNSIAFIDRLTFEILPDDDTIFDNPFYPDTEIGMYLNKRAIFLINSTFSSECIQGKYMYNGYHSIFISGRYEFEPESDNAFREADRCMQDPLPEPENHYVKYLIIGLCCGFGGLIIWTLISFFVFRRYFNRRN